MYVSFDILWVSFDNMEGPVVLRRAAAAALAAEFIVAYTHKCVFDFF